MRSRTESGPTKVAGEASVTPRRCGTVRGGRDAPIDDDGGQSRAWVELDPARFTPEALAGPADSFRAEVSFMFDRVSDDKIETDGPHVATFAQRGKNRPNRIGLTTCPIVAVNELAVEVEGLDAIDSTPVLDITPVLSDFLPRGEPGEPAWALETMRDDW